MDSSKPDPPISPLPGDGADVQDASAASPLPALEPGPVTLRSRWRRKLAPTADSELPPAPPGKEGFRSSWREKLKFNKPVEATSNATPVEDAATGRSQEVVPARQSFRARWRENLKFNKPLPVSEALPAQEQPVAEVRPVFRSRWKDNLRFNKPNPPPPLPSAVDVTGPIPVPHTEPEVAPVLPALGTPIAETTVALGAPLNTALHDLPDMECESKDILVGEVAAPQPEEAQSVGEVAFESEATRVAEEVACEPDQTPALEESISEPDMNSVPEVEPVPDLAAATQASQAPVLEVSCEVALPPRLDTLLAEALTPIQPQPAPPARVLSPVPEPPPPIRTPVYQPAARPAGSPGRSTIAVHSGETRSGARPVLPKHLRVSTSQICIFTRQFAAMTKAGVTVHRALVFYAEGGQEGVLPLVVDEVAYKVASGHRLSQALRQFPDVFSEVYVGLIETAETSSKLDEILERLANLLERQENLRKRVSSILIYPAFLAGASGIAIALFVYYVLPLMGGLFAGLNMELPWPTRMLLSLRQIMPAALAVLILAALSYSFGKFYFAALFRQRPRLRMAWDKILLSIPVLGSVCEKLSMSRILYALSNMVDAGLNLSDSMKRCVSVSGNSVIAERLELSRIDLMAGRSFHEALADHKVFPQACIQMLAVGEETSALDATFHHVARFYEDEIETTLTRFAALIEPAVMAGMGLFVGAIVLSAIMPTVKLLENL